MTSSRQTSAGLEVSLRSLSTTFGSVRLLRDLTWTICPGERWLVLGANGAGKSQLLKILAGKAWPDPSSRRQIIFSSAGIPVDPIDALDRVALIGPDEHRKYIGFEWNIRVQDVICGEALKRSSLNGLYRRRLDAITKELLCTFGLVGIKDRLFPSLSIAEKRLVLIARLARRNPDLFLLDEVLDDLDPVNAKRLLTWLDRVPHPCGSWVLVTHKVNCVPRSVTHLLRLSKGEIEFCGIVRRRQIRNYFEKCHEHFMVRTKKMKKTRAQGVELVRFINANVYVDYKLKLKKLEFAVSSGDCVVIHGHQGSGKSALVRTIYGEHAVSLGGELYRRGIRRGVPISNFKRWCSISAPHQHFEVPQGDTVLATIVSGQRATIGIDEKITSAEIKAAKRAAGHLRLEKVLQQRFSSLSHGERQRVLFCRAIVSRPRLLLLDDVFVGVDSSSRGYMLSILSKLVLRESAIIVACQHRDEWPSFANKEIELASGHIEYCGAVRR